jgi:Eco57I restriction-modification methylase
VDYRERVADGLAAFADELPVRAAAADELYGAWVALSFGLARSVLRDADSLTSLARELDAGRDAAAWAFVLEIGCRLHLDGPEHGARCAAILERHPPSARVLAAVLDWTRGLAARASDGRDGVARELGALHELFLGLGFRLLEAPARRLRRSRAWLSPGAVLDWAPELRAKRLQRELGLSKHTAYALGPALAAATCSEHVESALSGLLDPREPAREAGRYVLAESSRRRTTGAHYTPSTLCAELCERALAPLLARLPAPRSEALLALRVCDPAMGAGAFLIAAAHELEVALLDAWRAESAEPLGPARQLEARRLLVTRVLCGVDSSPLAVSIARLSLAMYAGDDGLTPVLRAGLREGDAVLGGTEPRHVPPAPLAARAFDWRAAFPDVFSRDNPGFDAVLGNPPWVAYVGRAAQPLPEGIAAYYAATNPAFKRYRTLHGLFVYRAAELLRAGGRLGLVLPTSVADLDGYAPTRAAHDALCGADSGLPDWENGAFDGVFQPCMALLSTRRASALSPPAAAWPLRSDALGPVERGLLSRLDGLPRLPRELFGERGFQTTEDDQAHLARVARSHPPHTVALREGADVAEFAALPPQLFAAPAAFGARLRPADDWRAVKVLIRQTARFPMAALSDGAAFRNSVLAGFESPEFSAALLLGLLNGSLIRWLHYTRQRDARQGMPQLKVGHLRALPAPPASAARAALEGLARRLGESNAGVAETDRARLDELVADTYGLSAEERTLVSSWAALHPPPVSRRKARLARPAPLPAREF